MNIAKLRRSLESINRDPEVINHFHVIWNKPFVCLTFQDGRIVKLDQQTMAYSNWVEKVWKTATTKLYQHQSSFTATV